MSRTKMMRVTNMKTLRGCTVGRQFVACAASAVASRSFSVSSATHQAKEAVASTRPTVVQKFGGTSLGTSEKLHKVQNIVKRFHPENQVVAVVSALSSETKSEGTTSRLLAAATDAVSGKDTFNFHLDKIIDTHVAVLNDMLEKGGEDYDAVDEKVHQEIQFVRQFCESLTVIKELSPRSHDLIIGTGERLAAHTVSGVLRANGVDSVPVDLSNLIPEGLSTREIGYHRSATSKIGVAMHQLFASRADSGQPFVPVVTGYLGNIKGGIIAGVGRGYSDLTAALVAASLGASALQVWKESDGIFTGNPTKLSNARLLHLVTPKEAAELTYFGNEVLHPFTMECAIEANIPIHILNTFTPSSQGTVIDPTLEPEVVFSSRGSSRGVTAVVSKKDVRVLNIVSNRMLGSTTFLARVFEAFTTHAVKVDLISTSETNLSITIHESIPEESVNALVKDLDGFCATELQHGKAILSVIGEAMRDQVGLAGKMLSVLSDANINLEMITQGASELNMSVVIDAKDSDKGIQVVHAQFLEDLDE